MKQKIILAVESGGEMFSAALRIGDATRQESILSPPHSAHALPLIRKLLADAKIKLAQCDAFAFGAGPGKFSGLRLACGIAQAFAFATSRPGIAVDSLAALAEANYSDAEKTATAALPAHRGYAHIANCRRDNFRWKCGRIRLLAAAEYAPAARVRNICGRGFSKYPMMAERAPNAILSQIAPHPDAAAVAKLAAAMYKNGETLPPEKCLPRYIRTKIAQTIAERRAEK